MELRALTFDVYGTLLDWENTWARAAQRMLTKYSSMVNANEFVRIWKSKTHELGYKNYEKYVTLLPKGLAETFRHYGIKGDPKHARLIIDNWSSMKPFPDVPPSLRKLKKHFALAIISNTDNQLIEKVLKVFGVNFEVVVTSEMARAYKPSPKIYETALKLLRYKASEVMHVARSQYDVAGAKSFGMKGTWVNRASETFQEEPLPDKQVSDLRELVEFLIE